MNEQSSTPNSSGDPQTSPTFGSGLIAVGSELLNEMQHIVGHSKVKALRINLGNRHIKDIQVNGATALVTIGLALLAVIISNLRVEVVKE
jgi:hypothetical protein